MRTIMDTAARLAEEVMQLRQDVQAYRAALGYQVPEGFDGRLSDGTIPVNGIAKALQADVEEWEETLKESRELTRHTRRMSEIVARCNDELRRQVQSLEGMVGKGPRGAVAEAIVPEAVAKLRRDYEAMRNIHGIDPVGKSLSDLCSSFSHQQEGVPPKTPRWQEELANTPKPPGGKTLMEVFAEEDLSAVCDDPKEIIKNLGFDGDGK